MQLLKFYKTSIEGLDLEIKSVIHAGAKRFLVVQEDERDQTLIKKFIDEKLTFHILKDVDSSPFQDKIKEYDVVILTEDKDLNSLSKQLLSCLDIEMGIVLAPLTDNYFMKRPFFLMTIPKSGTHMLTNMLSHLDIQRNYSHLPVPGKYSTLEDYTYHAPCKEFMLREWPDPVGRHPFFRSPAIFMYRNPLDIIVSELSWYKKPEIAFSHYLKTFEDSDEKLMHLIDDPLVIGTIRDRMNMYIGWLNFSNVIPISYEEIVGANGGGSDIEQTKTIWSLQLKLHIPGNPVELTKTIYNDKSPTFNKGNIGRHKKLFKEIHYKRFKALPQDFMGKMGYDINKVGVPKYIDYYRRRPLEYWQPTEKELWAQRLIKENFMGYNIVATAGQYVAVSCERGTLDLSKKSDRKKEGVHMGFESLEEATQFIKQNFYLLKPQLLDSYLNFNLIRYKDRIYAILHGLEIDLLETGKSEIKKYQDEKRLFIGDTIDETKDFVNRLAPTIG